MRTFRLTAIGFVLLLSACTWWQPLKHLHDQDGSSSSSSTGTVIDEKQTATLVLDALMTKDMNALIPLVDPKKGVRFTPETHVRLTAQDAGGPADRVVYADQLLSESGSTKKETWGVADGSGEPIELTFEQYLSKYVADHDYRNAKDVRWNHVMDRGSSVDNAMQAYPDAQIVEYHFPGFDAQYGGLDWTSLRLVLQKNADGHWYLIGVIHDHWTP